jgi:hypothetical protein
LGEYSQNKPLRALQEEMVAGEHVQRERTASMAAPIGQVFSAYLGIVSATKRRDGTGKWFSLLVYIGLANGKIGSKARKIHLHELRIHQNFLGCAAQPPKLGEDLQIRQLVNRRVPVWKSWRSMSGDHDMDGACDAPRPQPTGKLEAYQRAHTVPEERIWPGEEGGNQRS